MDWYVSKLDSLYNFWCRFSVLSSRLRRIIPCFSMH